MTRALAIAAVIVLAWWAWRTWPWSLRKPEDSLRGELYRVRRTRIGGIVVDAWERLPDWPRRR